MEGIDTEMLGSMITFFGCGRWDNRDIKLSKPFLEKPIAVRFGDRLF